MKLVKTIGGKDGAPNECNRCGSEHFIRSQIAWHCSTCGTYIPTRLGFEGLKEKLEKLYVLNKETKFVRQKLEELN